MERIATGAGNSAPLADAGAARAAIAAAGALPELERALRQAAAVIVGRFNADHAAIVVQPHAGHGHEIAVDASGNDDAQLRSWVSRRGKAYHGAVALESPISGAISGDSAGPRIRTIMHLPLQDERGETIGMAAALSDKSEAFDQAQFEEFGELIRLLSGFVRRALLLDQVARERALLAHEAALMAQIADAPGETDVARLVADTLRVAIGADLAVVVRGARTAGTGAGNISSPEEALSAGDWQSLREAVVQPGNGALLAPTSEGCYVNFDVQQSAPSPVERWIASHTAQRSFLLARGPRLAQTQAALAATRRTPEPWSGAEVSFAGRLAGLLRDGNGAPSLGATRGTPTRTDRRAVSAAVVARPDAPADRNRSFLREAA